jgi:hypothetical protein
MDDIEGWMEQIAAWEAGSSDENPYSLSDAGMPFSCTFINYVPNKLQAKASRTFA